MIYVGTCVQANSYFYICDTHSNVMSKSTRCRFCMQSAHKTFCCRQEGGPLFPRHEQALRVHKHRPAHHRSGHHGARDLDSFGRYRPRSSPPCIKFASYLSPCSARSTTVQYLRHMDVSRQKEKYRTVSTPETDKQHRANSQQLRVTVSRVLFAPKNAHLEFVRIQQPSAVLPTCRHKCQ